MSNYSDEAIERGAKAANELLWVNYPKGIILEDLGIKAFKAGLNTMEEPQVVNNSTCANCDAVVTCSHCEKSLQPEIVTRIAAYLSEMFRRGYDLPDGVYSEAKANVEFAQPEQPVSVKLAKGVTDE